MITLMRRERDGNTSGCAPADVPLCLALVGCGRMGPSLREALEDEGAVARVVTREGLDTLTGEVEPDLVVLGAAPNDDALLELVSELVEMGPPVLFLAPRSDPELARKLLAAGADDALPPPHSGPAILFRAAIIEIRRKAGENGGRDLRFGGRVLDRKGRRLVDGARPIHLSGREFELLDRLLEEDGGVVPRETLLRDIWGEDQDSEGVLEATVHRLRRKLEEDVSEPRHLTTVRGIGYRLEPAGERPVKG